MITRFFSNPTRRILTILLLGVLAYSNTLESPFVYDDGESILHNPVIQDISNFSPGGPGYESYPRRWIGYFTFAVNYHFGGLNVSGYHFFNLTIHLITGLLAYSFVSLTFRTPYMTGSRLSSQAPMIGLLAALFFVIHPVQIQAVTYIVQRLTSLCTLFYLLALILYIQARLQFESRTPRPAPAGVKINAPTVSGTGSGRTRLQAVTLLTCSVVAALLAMKTKEIAFTLPLAIALYEVSFFNGEWKRRTRMLLPLLLTLPIIPVSVLMAVDESSGDLSSQISDLRAHSDMPRLHYLFTQFRVIATYLRLLVLPINQNLDYDYPVFTSFFNPSVFLSFLLLLALFLLALYLYGFRVKNPAASLVPPPEFRLFAYGIFWFFLTLSVESSIFPIADVIFEHRIYLASFGPAVAVAVFLNLAAEKTSAFFSGRLPLLVGCLVVAALTVATWQRNQIWQNEVSLWEDTARKSPDKARPWYNLGTHLTDSRRPAEAIPALQRAIKIDPQHADAWHNLGRALMLSGRTAEAVTPLRTAVLLKPEMDNAVINLAAALINTGNFTEAVPHLERVRRRIPNWPEVRLNLGIAYVGIGNLQGARGELAVLYRLAPQLAPTLVEWIRRATDGL